MLDLRGISDHHDPTDDNHRHHHVHHQQHQPGLPWQARSREPGRSHQEDEAGSVQVPDHDEDDGNQEEEVMKMTIEVLHIITRGHL